MHGLLDFSSQTNVLINSDGHFNKRITMVGDYVHVLKADMIELKHKKYFWSVWLE